MKKWMRPPYTDYDGRVTEASDAGLSVTAWDVDTADWEHKNPERTRKIVLEQPRAAPSWSCTTFTRKP